MRTSAPIVLLLLLSLPSPAAAATRKLNPADLAKLPPALGAKAFKVDTAQSFVVDLAQKGTLFVTGRALTGAQKGRLRVLLVTGRAVAADLSAGWSDLDRRRAKVRAVTFRDINGDGVADVALIVRVAGAGKAPAEDHGFCYAVERKKVDQLCSDSGRRLRLGPLVAQASCEQACTTYAACSEEVNGGTFHGGGACVDACVKKGRKERRRWLECVFKESCKKVVSGC